METINYQLIILPNQSLIVSDEEAKKDDWCYNIKNKYNFPVKIKSISSVTPIVSILTNNTSQKIKDEYIKFVEDCHILELKKIIAGHQDLPTIDYSELSDEDCKKIGYVDVRKIALSLYPKNSQMDFSEDFRRTFTIGFKTAQSLNDNKFSLEDMKFIFECGRNYQVTGDIDFHFTNAIQSLQQPKVFQIEVEMEEYLDQSISEHGCYKQKLKIINNSIKITKVL